MPKTIPIITILPREEEEGYPIPGFFLEVGGYQYEFNSEGQLIGVCDAADGEPMIVDAIDRLRRAWTGDLILGEKE